MPPTATSHDCPKCGKSYRIPPSPKTRTATCTACGAKFTVPPTPGAAASGPMAPTAGENGQATAAGIRSPVARPPADRTAGDRTVAGMRSPVNPRSHASPAPPARQVTPDPAGDALDAFGGGALDALSLETAAPSTAGPAANAASAAGASATVRCPGCGEQLPAGARLCVFCATDVKTGKKIKTVHAAMPPSPRPALPGTGADGSPRATLREILVTPFSASLLAHAAVILLGTAGWYVVGILAALAVAMVSRGHEAGRVIIAVIAFGVSLAAVGWVSRHYFAIARQYFRAQDLNVGGFSIVGSLMRIFVISIIALAPGLALVFLRGGSALSPGVSLDRLAGSVLLALLLGLIVAYLYTPMAMAVVGAYDTLNPLTVLDRLKTALGPYLLVLLVGGALYGATWLVSGGVLLALSSAGVHELISSLVFGFLSAVLTQYVFVALMAMLGALLRRYPDPGTPVPLSA